MKMVLAIINYDDSQDVISSLMKAGFSITKLATTGGFLKAGNVTILIGLDESKLDECFDIIREHSSSRKQIMPATAELGMGFFPRPRRCRSKSAAQPYLYSTSSVLKSCDFI